MIKWPGIRNVFVSISVLVALTCCPDKRKHASYKLQKDTATITTRVVDSFLTKSKEVFPKVTDSGKKVKVVPKVVGREIVTGTIHPDSIVAFAKTLLGIPYLYASTDPRKGFDCSGFITYVFNHFDLAVPRSSVDFTNMGRDITIDKAKPGDLILFTGTDSTKRIVGHMGIVESVKDGNLQFIHSTSGKLKGVVITPFQNYYRSRFVKIIRVFPEELFKD